MPTTQIRARVDAALKRKSDAVLKQLGLNTGSFVSMALTQLVHRRGLPFSVSEPDAAYFTSEYGLTAAQAAKAGAAMRREAAQSRRSGSLREIKRSDDLIP
jgi:addiction module RelB/DinJ family antitoxin